MNIIPKNNNTEFIRVFARIYEIWAIVLAIYVALPALFSKGSSYEGSGVTLFFGACFVVVFLILFVVNAVAIKTNYPILIFVVMLLDVLAFPVFLYSAAVFFIGPIFSLLI